MFPRLAESNGVGEVVALLHGGHGPQQSVPAVFPGAREDRRTGGQLVKTAGEPLTLLSTTGA